MLWALVACGRFGVRPISTTEAGALHPDAGARLDAGAAYSGADAAADSGSRMTCPTLCENAHGSADCGSGQCQVTCEIGYADCDHNVQNGCETSTVTEVLTCGDCNVSCVNAQGNVACAEGVCVPSCVPGSSGDCDGNVNNGCESNLATDVAACGGCGVSCKNANGTTSCSAGMCKPACAAGYGDCDGDPNNGCETRTDSDPAHCGGCGTSCDTSFQVCASGACTASTCPQGRGDCDTNSSDCEVDLTTALDNCGFCQNVCATANGTPQCVSGACATAACDPGYDDCDGTAANGCEVTLATSVANCGSCGTACGNAHGTTVCSGGACVPTCSSGYGNCDSDPRNGCETALSSTSNCGGCGNVCPNAMASATAVCNTGICGYTCNDLSGVYALRLNVQATWPAKTYIRSGSGTLQFWLRLTLSQSGTTLSANAQLCDQTSPETQNSVTSDRYLIQYPAALFTPGAPGASFSITLGSLAPGASVSSTKAAHLLGIALSNPLTDTWPSLSTARAEQVDHDADSEVGITVNFVDDATYNHVQTDSTLFAPRASAAYGAQRLRFSLGGSLTGCTGASGSATVQSFDTKTIGCRLESGQDCSLSQYQHIDDNAAVYSISSATYNMVKLGATGGSFTCPQVRAAL